MRSYVGLDVSQATTAICVVGEDGRTLAEGKVPTCPRAIAVFVRTQAPELIRIRPRDRTARGLALRRPATGRAARDLPRCPARPLPASL